MKIHEYQAKEILRRYGVPLPEGGMARTAKDARSLAEKLGAPVVVKAQIHAGGRGKGTLTGVEPSSSRKGAGHGVQIAPTIDEAEAAAQEILGACLVTHQTGAEGQEVRQVLVEQGVDIASEYYLGVVIDRAKDSCVIMASREGGVEIEKVAATAPEKIIKVHVPPSLGYRPYLGRRLASGLGLEGKEAINRFESFVQRLYRLFEDEDCSLAEINPLVRTAKGDFLALDAKLNLDDNASFRHGANNELRDLSEENAQEVEASKYNLNYIKLDGVVGCMVNGAGLAMATMDIILDHGARPANFLDVGGTANPETVEAGFRIILADPKVKAILVNIFGGIVRCDLVAQGVIEAAKKAKVEVPIVIRLEGTNAEQARALLKDSGMDFEVAEHLADAASKAAAAAKRAA